MSATRNGTPHDRAIRARAPRPRPQDTSDPRPQPLRALDRANEIRAARAALRQKIASGEIFAASVLLQVPFEARTMTVGELLIAQHQWGRRTTRRFLARGQVSEVKQLCQLTERQRVLLARQLGETR